jgi:RND family efflux transporter MFP subunit
VLRRALSILALLSVATLGVSCGSKERDAAGASTEVIVAPVQRQDVEIHSEWVGTTTGYVNAQIHPKIQGYLLKQAYRDGGLVKEGDLLFQIDPRQFQAALDQAKGQVARSRAVLVRNEIDVKRYTPLAAVGAVSQEELDNAVQARAASAAQVQSDQAAVETAQLNLEWTQVKAPITGVAAIATAQVGDLVSPQTLLTTVSQLDPIKVAFPVSEIDYLRFAGRIREGEQSGRAGNPGGLALILADGTVYPHRGSFRVAGLAVSATTGTIDVQGEFPNSENLLRPGQFAKVRAVTGRIEGALVIPQRAVRDLQGVTQVAVVGPGDKVAFRNVKLGPTTGTDYVVTGGIRAGDRVVVEGLQKIRDGMVVKPAPAPASPAGRSGK